jgi:hypothetical protein
MLWGGRRDLLPASQEVKWRGDGNPPTNTTVPAPIENSGSGAGTLCPKPAYSKLHG